MAHPIPIAPFRLPVLDEMRVGYFRDGRTVITTWIVDDEGRGVRALTRDEAGRAYASIVSAGLNARVVVVVDE